MNSPPVASAVKSSDEYVDIGKLVERADTIPLEMQMAILAELRQIRAELVKLNAAGGALMSTGF